jgi:hypothetical protein
VDILPQLRQKSVVSVTDLQHPELADFGARWVPKFNPSWRAAMRGALLWLLGIPIPIIILLYLFNVI